MTDLTPEGTVRAFFEALNARDFARAAGPIAENCEWVSLGSGLVHRGPGPIVAGLREFATAFPDWHVDLPTLITSGDKVVVEWITSGTFQQPFRGEAPNGKRFVRRGCAVAEVVGGKIVRYRDYYDRAILLRQLDLMHLLEGVTGAEARP